VDSGLEQRVRAEAIVREVNERIRDVREALAAGEEIELDLLCECGDPSCTALLTVTLAEYEAARTDPRRLLVTPDHAQDEGESVVAANGRFAIVQASGEAADLLRALALD
jgi:hypothetical protein